MTSPAERLGLLLARQRMRAGLTQEDLALLAGIHRTDVSLLERGGRRARLDTILKLAVGVESEPCELLSGMRWIPGTVELVAGVDWEPYEILEGEGAFEVLEDSRLLDEVAARKEARPTGRASESS